MKKILLSICFIFTVITAYSQVLFTVKNLSDVQYQTFRGEGQMIFCSENSSMYEITYTPSNVANGTTIIALVDGQKFAERTNDFSGGGGGSSNLNNVLTTGNDGGNLRILNVSGLSIGGTGTTFRLDVGPATSGLSVFRNGGGSNIFIGQSGNTRFGYAGNAADLLFTSGGSKPFAMGTFDGQDFTLGANNASILRLVGVDGTINFTGFGLGNKEDGDLTKTESAYVLVPAIDGTILEKPISELGGGSVWTNLDGTGATSSSTDIKYNGGQVGVGFEDSETLPSSKSLAVEGNMSIQREDGAGFTSLTGYRDNGTTPVWQIHDKNFAMNLSLTDGGENLVITNNGVIVSGNVPRARLSSQHGSQWQLALQDDANKATLVRHEDDGLTRMAFTDDGGSTTKDLFWRGNGNDISTTNSLTGVVGHINSIIKLTDNIDDDTKVAYTIPVVSYKHTASIFFICDSSSENDGGDGCAVETANAVLINGSSNFILPELGKVYELRYSEDLGEWFIMNL